MAISPFGPSGVVLRWPYLGGVVGCRGALSNPPLARWAPLDLRRMREAAWSKAADKYADRVGVLASSGLPPGGRADSWNTYVVTVLPYLARMFHADAALRNRLARGMATAFCTGGWAPPVALSALGVVHGVSGSPRDPAAVIMAVGAAAWLGSRGWGPGEEGEVLRSQVVGVTRALQGELEGGCWRAQHWLLLLPSS